MPFQARALAKTGKKPLLAATSADFQTLSEDKNKLKTLLGSYVYHLHHDAHGYSFMPSSVLKAISQQFSEPKKS